MCLLTGQRQMCAVCSRNGINMHPSPMYTFERDAQAATTQKQLVGGRNENALACVEDTSTERKTKSRDRTKPSTSPNFVRHLESKLRCDEEISSASGPTMHFVGSFGCSGSCYDTRHWMGEMCMHAAAVALKMHTELG